MSHVAWSVCLCVCRPVLGTQVSCAKMAEPVDAVWGQTRVSPVNYVLDGAEVGRIHLLPWGVTRQRFELLHCQITFGDLFKFIFTVLLPDFDCIVFFSSTKFIRGFNLHDLTSSRVILSCFHCECAEMAWYFIDRNTFSSYFNILSLRLHRIGGISTSGTVSASTFSFSNVNFMNKHWNYNDFGNILSFLSIFSLCVCSNCRLWHLVTTQAPPFNSATHISWMTAIFY